MSEICETNEIQRNYALLKSLLSGAAELTECFKRCSRQTSDPQLRDEYQKLAAASRNHQEEIVKLLEVNGNNE